jgi:hypothetical protein
LTLRADPEGVGVPVSVGIQAVHPGVPVYTFMKAAFRSTSKRLSANATATIPPAIFPPRDAMVVVVPADLTSGADLGA